MGSGLTRKGDHYEAKDLGIVVYEENTTNPHRWVVKSMGLPEWVVYATRLSEVRTMVADLRRRI